MAMKEKSARKPLRDMSNDDVGRASPKSRVTPQEEKENYNASKVDEEDHALDRLLLVHSDLSSLIQQIDEIVAQAFKMKESSIQGTEEIASFTNVLSEMLSSLKPWVPKFQKVLTHPTTQSENQFRLSLNNNNICAVKEPENKATGSPDQIKTELLLSPSPLVSWRANCTVERGRQLFLLTPLPISKALSSKSQVPSKLAFDGNNHSLSFFTAHGGANEKLLAGLNQTPCKPSDSQLTKVFSLPTKNCSMVVVTPCLKMSPPKSCVLLEPISECSHQVTNRPRKSTPFPPVIRQYLANQFSASLGSETPDGLASNYPEIIGLQGANREGKKKKEIEASPDWLFSPPKTCVLLELADVDSQEIVAMDVHPTCSLNKHTNAISMENSFRDIQPINFLNFQDYGEASVAPVKSTPMKEKQSSIRAGRRPGENTLKKELWTKFEAASSRPYRFNVSTVKKKGFLDLLDEAEASCV